MQCGNMSYDLYVINFIACNVVNTAASVAAPVQMVLKCADIGHLAADTATHKKWSLKLEEEFFRQVSAHLPTPPPPP